MLLMMPDKEKRCLIWGRFTFIRCFLGDIENLPNRAGESVSPFYNAFMYEMALMEHLPDAAACSDGSPPTLDGALQEPKPSTTSDGR
jgi:hypothetical protein